MNKNVTLFLSLFIFLVSCTTAVKIPILSNDLSLFKGTWEGVRQVTYVRGPTNDLTILEIFNDTIPLKGKIVIFYQGASDIREYPFENGQITPDGNLAIQLAEDTRVNLSLYKQGEKLKLLGNYSVKLQEGKLELYKK